MAALCDASNHPSTVLQCRIGSMSPETATVAAHRASQLETALRKVIRGKDDVVRLALVSILARTPADRRRSGSRQNYPRPSSGPCNRLQLPACAVHQRYAPVRRDWNFDLLGYGAAVRVQTWPRIHQHSAGR